MAITQVQFSSLQLLHHNEHEHHFYHGGRGTLFMDIFLKEDGASLRFHEQGRFNRWWLRGVRLPTLRALSRSREGDHQVTTARQSPMMPSAALFAPAFAAFPSPITKRHAGVFPLNRLASLLPREPSSQAIGCRGNSQCQTELESMWIKRRVLHS